MISRSQWMWLNHSATVLPQLSLSSHLETSPLFSIRCLPDHTAPEDAYKVLVSQCGLDDDPIVHEQFYVLPLRARLITPFSRCARSLHYLVSRLDWMTQDGKYAHWSGSPKYIHGQLVTTPELGAPQSKSRYVEDRIIARPYLREDRQGNISETQAPFRGTHRVD